MEKAVAGIEDIHSIGVEHNDPYPKYILIVRGSMERVVWIDFDIVIIYEAVSLAAEREMTFLEQETELVKSFGDLLVSFHLRPLHVRISWCVIVSRSGRGTSSKHQVLLKSCCISISIIEHHPLWSRVRIRKLDSTSNCVGNILCRPSRFLRPWTIIMYGLAFLNMGSRRDSVWPPASAYLL